MTKILDINIIDFFEAKKIMILNRTNQKEACNLVHNLHAANKEIYEKEIQSKDEQIEMLKEQMLFYKNRAESKE